MEEKIEIPPGFYKCPFCSCFFCCRADLEAHIAAFGEVKGQHLEALRRAHAQAEYSSTE